MTSLLIDDFVQRAYLPNLCLSHHRFREQGLGSLSTKQIKQFDEQGYVVIRGFLTGADIDGLNADIEPAVKYAEGIKNKNLVRRNNNGNVNLLTGPSSPERKSSPFYQCIRHPDVVAKLQSILGPNIIENSSKVIVCEPQGSGAGAFSFVHQDTANQSKFPATEITTWIAMTPSSEKTGTLHVVPGSHLWGLRCHEKITPLSFVKVQEPAIVCEDLAFGLETRYPSLGDEIYKILAMDTAALENFLIYEHRITPEEIVMMGAMAENETKFYRSLLSTALLFVSKSDTAVEPLNPGDAVVSNSFLWHFGSSPQTVDGLAKRLVYRLEVPFHLTVNSLYSTDMYLGTSPEDFLLSQDMDIINVPFADVTKNYWN